VQKVSGGVGIQEDGPGRFPTPTVPHSCHAIPVVSAIEDKREVVDLASHSTVTPPCCW
jgi:hypothetical protein